MKIKQHPGSSSVPSNLRVREFSSLTVKLHYTDQIMAAAYAALVSLTNIIHTLQNHPKSPITLPNHQLQSLLQKVTFLQEFLELHSHEDAYPTDGLESLIRDAAHAAEDAIESYIVDQIGGSTSDVEGRINSFNQDLQKAIEDFDITVKKAMQIEEMKEVDEAHQHIVSSMPNALPVPPSLGQKKIMVGFGNLLTDILDKLTGQENKRNIIPIVGMGGSGKTTLALNAYEHALVVHRFDIRVWIPVSQKFIAREILLEILCSKSQENIEEFSHMSEMEIGERIHKNFSGMRYLIVLDDIWSTEVWDEIRYYFPDNDNGSRIIITTRISRVAIQLSGTNGVRMNLLSDEESWSLFCNHVFGEKDACPLDWEEIGKMIARNCKGLPLSITVVGGLLAKSKMTKQYWEYVARNLNSIVNLEDNEHCLRILHMSYKQLSIHLKPCFLYLGIFPEDDVIRVSRLVKLLVAEGFLKPIGRKSIAVVAEEYIKELADRNLILVYEWGYNGNIKYCKIHDLLRDVCLKEAQKEMFLYVMGEHDFSMNGVRRIVLQRRTSISMEKHPSQELGGFLSAPLARSLICRDECAVTDLKLKLLRICIANRPTLEKKDKILKVGDVYNLRYFHVYRNRLFTSKKIDIIHCSTNLLWNLQTVIFDGYGKVVPIAIWKMAQLRHIIVNKPGFHLPEPRGDKFVLQNLQTLGFVEQFKFSTKVIEKIPNIKKLKILYTQDWNRQRKKFYLNNVEHLHQLEHLYCGGGSASSKYLKQTLTFPCSLKKLYLKGFNFFWEDITTKIGPLPNLEKLTLERIKGHEWRPVEGQFLCLKCLRLFRNKKLKTWIVDKTCFPVLEHLSLKRLRKLREIPSTVGDIPTLKSIKLSYCSNSAIFSTKKIIEEQEELGNSSLLATAAVLLKQVRLLSLSSDNFQVEVPVMKRWSSIKGRDNIRMKI